MAVAMWATLSQLREIQEDNRLQGLSSIRQDYLTHRNDFYSWLSGPWADEELLRTTHEGTVDKDSVPHSLEWQFQTRLMGMLDNIEHAATLVEQGMLPEEHGEIIQRHIREDVRRILSLIEYDPVSGILHIGTNSQVQNAGLSSRQRRRRRCTVNWGQPPPDDVGTVQRLPGPTTTQG